MHLFFFALLCAISFPAVINKAMSDLLNDKAKAIAAEAATSDPKKLEGVASEVATTKRTALAPKAAIDLETGLLTGVDAVANAGELSDENRKAEAVTALEATKTAARQAGFEKVGDRAQQAIQNLQRETDPVDGNDGN